MITTVAGKVTTLHLKVHIKYTFPGMAWSDTHTARITETLAVMVLYINQIEPIPKFRPMLIAQMCHAV